MNHYNESLIDAVRAEIPAFIGGKRLAHTYAVERECVSLISVFSAHPMLFSEEDGYKLRIAALLHDITKEKTVDEQIALAAKYRIPLTDFDLASPKVLHAKTAPALAADTLNPKFGWNVVCDTVRDAIYTHTTGGARMSLAGRLLYLADYIEDTRTFSDCVTLRHTFYDGLDAVKDDRDSLSSHLDTVMLLSFDMTIRDLLSQGALIHADTTAARNALLFRKTR
ncbi:MAG: HD domain-containing protein [Clostridia bacterium]|nr:HD domain-containing protein [Clostridia bacterium]